MRTVHQKVFLNTGDIIEVDSSHVCNARLMTDVDTALLMSKSAFYTNDHEVIFKLSPVNLVAPNVGVWNIIIIFKDDNDNIKYSIRKISLDT